MNSDRLEQLLEFYKEDPNDPFNIYALATEYKSSAPEKALEFYELLIANHPDYVATYYHLGHLYEEIGEDDKAKTTYEKGIEVASTQKNSLALRELKSSYDEFMMDF